MMAPTMTTQELASEIERIANRVIPAMIRASDKAFVETTDPRALEGGAVNWETSELRKVQEILHQAVDCAEAI